MTETTTVPETKTGDEGKDLSQDAKVTRTPEEIAKYNLKKKADEAKALGIDPKEVLGGSDDEVPAWYKAEKAKEITKTAMQLADGIADEETRDKVKATLGRLAPSENPEEDFRLALGAVSAPKNKQILEEMNRYGKPRIVAAGGGQPASQEEEFVPTPEETVFMRPPYKMSKEKILAARKANEAKMK